MSDVLAKLDEREVAAFYRRLALGVQTKFGGDSLAATLLLHWLDGNGQPKVFPSKYVRDLDEVRSYLRDTARPIFLSRKPTPQGNIGGVVPRIKGIIKANPAGGPYPMHLDGNVETPLSVEAKAAAGLEVAPRELDALFGLHGFTMNSDVVASVIKSSRPRMYSVKFDRWICKASDEYHWNPSKHITVPNPDFGSKDKGAVSPTERTIKVFHSNAARIERAGLAKPFHDESEPWDETDLTVVRPEMVTV